MRKVAFDLRCLSQINSKPIVHLHCTYIAELFALLHQLYNQGLHFTVIRGVLSVSASDL